MPDKNNPNEDDLLFRLLTEEIKDRHDASKLRGWTPWLLLAALASMASVLVEEIWARPVRVEAVRACFIMGSLVIVSVLAGRSILTAITEREAGRPRFLFLERTGTPESILLLACWFGAMSAACFLHRATVTSYALTSVGWVLAFFSVFSVVMVFARAAKLPLPINRGPVIPRVIVFGVLLALCVGSIDAYLELGR
jgi:hypothetical protein